MRNRKIGIFAYAVLFAALFFVQPIFAAERSLMVTDVTISDKSATVSVDNLSVTDNTIGNNIHFNKEGDYLALDIALKNQSQESLKITGVSDNIAEDYLNAEYSYSGDEIAPNANSILNVKISYKKKALNIDKISLSDITITLELEKIDHTKTYFTINPTTNDSIMTYIAIFTMSVAVIIILIIIAKKHKKTKNLVTVFIVIATLFAAPIAAKALGDFTEEITISGIEIKGEFETYNVTFNPDNNSGITTISVTYGEPIGTLPTAPRKDGYNFIEWQDEDGAKIDETTVIKNQISVTAKYDAINYDISYDLDGGNLAAPNPTSYNIETSSFTLNKPQKEHYDFIGWTGSNSTEPQLEPTIEQGSTGSKNFVANYTPKQYTVSFNPNGGTINDADASREVSYGSPAGELPSTTRDGLSFDGWYTQAEEGEKITQNTIITGPIEFFAHWLDNSTLATSIIADKVNENGNYQIDYTKKAIISDRVDLANGNGVNIYKEDGEDIYYYRGEIYDNNVIWADKCWKILRTTKTGGTKLIYNGEPTEVNVNGETTPQCLSTGEDALIENVLDKEATSRLVPYNDDNDSCNSSNCSIASIGYMYGAPSKIIHISSSKLTDSYKYYFSDGVTINGNEATLNTGTGHIYSGYWTDADFRNKVKENHHYFCADNKNKCSLSNLRWKYYSAEKVIYALSLSEYHNPDDLIAATQENISDSSAKKIVDAWYEQNLADKANDLEDTVFCGEKDIVKGVLFDHKDSNGQSLFGAMYRVSGNDGQMAAPSLDCNRKYSYTTSSANGNGKLRYKIGLISVDEAALAGEGRLDAAPQNFLTSGTRFWTMSPYGILSSTPYQISVGSDGSHNGKYVRVSNDSGLRPSVSLKAGTRFLSGDGTKENPYKTE